jgi:hypothetical protein
MRDFVIAAREVAAFPLDLDDPRPGVSEARSAEGRSDRLFQRNDQNAVESAGHQ